MEHQEMRGLIMIVDDEAMVLKSISSLISLETSCEAHSFTSPREALAFIQEHTVDLVISDYMMAEMDGITFLDRVRKVAPETLRVMLTGYAEKENAIRAINKIGLFQYIEKPWDNEDLLITIRNALDRRQLKRTLRNKMDQLSQTHTEIQNLQREILKAFA